jgi:biopolymer transport protein ExbD
MDNPESMPPPAFPPKMDEGGVTAPPPLALQGPPIPRGTRKNRTFLIIMLITLALLVLATGVVLAFLKSITTASLATAEVLQVDEDIELPVSRGKKKEVSKAGEFALNLKWTNGRSVFRFMEKDYEDEQALVAELKKLKATVPNSTIIIRGDKRLPAVEIQRAMRVMASAGFDAISFSTLDQN